MPIWSDPKRLEYSMLHAKKARWEDYDKPPAVIFPWASRCAKCVHFRLYQGVYWCEMKAKGLIKITYYEGRKSKCPYFKKREKRKPREPPPMEVLGERIIHTP